MAAITRIRRCSLCGYAVWYAQTTRGKWVSIDPNPVTFGNLTYVEGGKVRYIREGEALPPGTLRYMAHRSTCPDKEQAREPY
jgi:hypothetical protein